MDDKKPKNFPGKDGYQRLNYLHQIAYQVVSHCPMNHELARHYIECFREVKEKKVLRCSRAMKRSVCNGCNMVLVPGITSKIRVSGKRRIVITCLCCSTIKRVNSQKPKRKHRIKQKKQTSGKPA